MVVVSSDTASERPVRRVAFLAISALSCILAAGCALLGTGRPEETPVLPPPPPAELASLPVEVGVNCSKRYCIPKRGCSGVGVLELPGLPPIDPDSYPYADYGELQGTIWECTPATVTQYAWSDYDQEYFVYVVTDGLEGWVALCYVDLAPPP
jgi:hypothetical protein